MKVNIVIPSIVLGGGLRIIFEYANYMVEKGHDVIIYVPLIFRPNHEGFPKVRTSIGNLKRGTNIKWFDCKFKVKFALQFNDWFIRDADIIIATAWYTAKSVALLNNSKGEKWYFIQDYEVSEDNSNKIKVENTYKLPLNKIVIANWLEKKVFEISGVHSHVVYNGVKDNEFIIGEKTLNERKSIIMLGNVAPHKGGYNGLNILQNIQKKFNTRIIIYGAKPIENIPDTFEFYLQPERKKLMKLYEEADICLFPSVREGWGLIVTEALAHKCAVVGNNTGAIIEIGKNNVNMLIASDYNPSSLEFLLECLLHDNELIKKLQNNGYQTVKSLMTSKQAQLFCDLIMNNNKKKGVI